MLNALFNRSEPAEERMQATIWGDWGGGSMGTWSGQDVSASSSMQLLTVYGCVRLITDGVATTPVDVFRDVNGVKEEVPKPDWITQPTVDLDFIAWCTQVLSSLLLHGNAYIAVIRYPDGRGISELIPLDPAQVTVRRIEGRKTYWINNVRYTGEIRHIPGLMLPGADVGCSPIEYARQSIGIGLATTKYGAEYFENEGNMPGVIELPRPAQAETLRQIAESWRRKRHKGGRGLPGVLPDGATWKPTGVTNEQAQFLATRKFTASEIAGQMFLVDPTELGIGMEGSSLVYQNLEQRSIRKYEVTYGPWIVRIEKFFYDLLPKPRYLKFNVDARLRSDLLTRYQAYRIGLDPTAPFLDVSEVRTKEDMGPMAPAPAPQGAAPDPTPQGVPA